MKRITLSFLMILGAICGWAQTNAFSLDGYVRDDFTNAGIADANVYLLNNDSIVQDSAKTLSGYSSGFFRFNVKRDKSFRSCIIKVVHPSYKTSYSLRTLKNVGKNAGYEVPTIFVNRRSSFTERTLDEVVATATKVKMYYRGDTIVYNADAFNVADGSMLDALIKQMPGTELNKQGEIFVNGKKIDNLLLNGKDFFRGKNKLMLDNLPYYAVKDIKVYEQTSDKAKALHDDRAKKDYVMDVNLKKEYSKGYMANVEAGGGTKDAYLARLFGLRFTDVSRFAIVGGMNNLNMSDYSLSGNDIDNGVRDGRTTSNLLTAELMTEHKRNKNVLTAELKRKKSKTGADEFQETFHIDGSTFSTSQNSQIDKNLGVSLSNKYTLKIPFWMESTTQLRFNNDKDDGDMLYMESNTDTHGRGISMLDSLFNMGIAVNDPSMISARKRASNSKAKVYGAAQDFGFAKNLPTTDIIELSVGADYTKSNYDAGLFNQYLTWKCGRSQTDVLEDIDRPRTHVGAKADVSYKFSRLLYNTDLKFYAGYRFNRDKDRETITDLGLSLIDQQNSYNLKTIENIFTAGANYHYDRKNGTKKLRTTLDINLPLSVIDRKTDYARSVVDTSLVQAPVFFEPSLSFSHIKWRGNNISSTLWSIKASTSLKYNLPVATQLIAIPLTTDRINVYQGNAHLKSPATWNSNLSWSLPTKSTRTYLQQSLTYANYINRIVNTYRFNSGVYVNRPDNINGTWDIELSTRGQQVAKFLKLPLTINYNMKNSYHRMKNYTASGITGEAQQIDNNSLHNYAHIQIRSYYKKISGGFKISADWRKPLNDQTNMGYNNTWDFKGDFWLSANLPGGVDWETECVLVKRQGYSSDELNEPACDWRIGLSKSFFKNKLGVSLKAIDILKQYKSVAYVVNERGIRETHAVSLPSYLLLSVTYKFNKQPSKK